jgi:hypothetical protein
MRRARPSWGKKLGKITIDGALIERWALAYLGRFASSAENLRRVLLRRARRRLGEDREAASGAAALIDALVAAIARRAWSTMRLCAAAARGRGCAAASRCA